MLSEDYYGFNAASPRSNHRLISYRTELSAEKVINSKSREKKKMEDQQLENLKKKYDVSKNYNPDREKQRSKSRKIKERYDQIHSNNMKFKFHHYDDRGYYENNKEVKKRVEQRAIQALERNLSPKQNSIMSASERNGCVSQKLTRQVQQILTSKRVSRNGEAYTTRYIKSPPSHRSSQVESARSSSNNSHRHLRKMKPDEKRGSKISKDQNIYHDEYNLGGNNGRNIATTSKQSMILGTQTIRKQYQPYEIVNTSQRIVSQNQQKRNSQLIQKQQIELSQISLSSNSRHNQFLPVQFSRLSDGAPAQPQILATSDYERIKQLQQKAKDESILIENNKNIEYNNIPPMTSTLRSKYELNSNSSLPSHSNSNILSKVIKDSSEMLKNNTPQMPQMQAFKTEAVETYPYRSPPSLQENQRSFQFILNEGPSNQSSSHSSTIHYSSPSNLNNNILYPYGQVQSSHPQYPHYWQRRTRNAQKSDRSSVSSFNLSQTQHQQYAMVQPQMDSNNLRMSITNDNILNNSNTQPYSINIYNNNEMPTPPVIFQRPTQQNILLNSFNLLESLKEWTEVEDRKMCGLYSGFGSENQNLQKMMDKLYEHLAAINKISDFVEETQKFYIDDGQKQLFHICSFLLLKRFHSQRTKVVENLRSGNSCFTLTDKQISCDQIQKLKNTKAVNQFISEIEQNNKMIFNLLHRFYLQLKQQGYPPSMINLQAPSKQDTHLIMQKLNQELELLINKIDQNQHSNQKSTYEKDNEYEVISLRSFSIMQLVFLVSQLEGRKTKKLQQSIEPQDFEMYCKTHYSSYKETILYFH